MGDRDPLIDVGIVGQAVRLVTEHDRHPARPVGLAVLHALADRGEAEILATLVSSKNEFSGPCLEAINTWYGRPNLPIGYQRGHRYGYLNTKDPERDTTSRYTEAVARAFRQAKALDPLVHGIPSTKGAL